jgi:hypothetical protein
MDSIYRTLYDFSALYVHYDEALGGSYKVVTTARKNNSTRHAMWRVLLF